MKNGILEQFACHYSPTDFEKIRFDWNGEYGDKFFDKNYQFRMQLAEFLLPRLRSVKLDLIRDLYLEMGKSSEATFGVYFNFHRFAQELLERGGVHFLTSYIKGASHTMDTALASGRITLSRERAVELLNFFDEKRKLSTDPNELLLFNDYFRSRLEYYASK